MDCDPGAWLAAVIAGTLTWMKPLVRREKSPQSGGASVARDRPLAEREKCGDASAFKGHLGWPDCIDTAMKSM